MATLLFFKEATENRFFVFFRQPLHLTTTETRSSERVCSVLNLPEHLVAESKPQSAAANREEPVLVRFMKFKCTAGYLLIGSELLTCLSNGEWDDKLPQCKKQCSSPVSPKNGLVVKSQGILVEGSKVHFLCNKGYTLIGHNEITCLTSGNWNYQAPNCEKVIYCTDPGIVAFSNRLVGPGIGGAYSHGTIIKYECLAGALILGKAELECQKNGTWSASKPSCVFVSEEEVTCATKGTDVTQKLNIPIRVTCPGGCNAEKTEVWGTVIYRKESRVCAAAIHAGMIPATGGSVFVINSGIYNRFIQSHSNGIMSQSFRNPMESFRFDFLEEDEGSTCPSGWTEHGKNCIVFISKVASFKNAESICKNLASEMITGNGADETERNRLVARIALDKGQFKIWFGSRLNHTLESSNISNWRMEKEAKMAVNFSCAALDFQNGVTAKDCTEVLNFMCRINASFINNDVHFTDVVCDDPGSITFGSAKYEETVHGLFVIGSKIIYHCNPSYFLRGETNITCTINATWSGNKPACIKVPACKEPSAIKNGFYNIVSHLDIRTAGMQNPRSRIAQIISPSSKRGLSITYSANKTSESQANMKHVSISVGFHHIGTRVQFSCESRYYNLVGSSTRTCLSPGQWSGRQPTCQPVCGISSAPRAPFIVNGQPTNIGQWPWQVGLARRGVTSGATKGDQDQAEWFLTCGATLLNEMWVVTAAHCVTKESTMTVLAPSEFQLYFGKYYRSHLMDDNWVQVKKVNDIHVHPDFDPILFDGDIALLHLSEPVQLTNRVQPVCLPDISSGMSDRNLQTGTLGVVTGWGMDEQKEYSSTLLQADVPVVSSSECEQGYRDAGISISVSGSMFCAGYQDGKLKDACSGDSGGPFVMSEGTGVHERWFLEGIISWGSPIGCGEYRQYGGYTKVSTFLPWIQQFI